MRTFDHLQLELTNHCNLRCEICPNRKMERPRRYMSEEVFATVLEKVVSAYPIQSICVSKDGEPLLYPRLESVLTQLVQARPVPIDIYTNGLKLTRKKYDFLATLGVPVRLLLTYHLYNYDGSRNDYRKVTEVVRSILADPAPSIGLSLVLHVSHLVTVNDIEEWAMTWNGLEGRPGVEVIVNRCIQIWSERVPEGNMRLPNCVYDNGTIFFIGVTGNTPACCVDLEEEVNFGNILTDDMETILDRRETFYNLLKEGKRPVEMCRRCLGTEK